MDQRSFRPRQSRGELCFTLDRLGLLYELTESRLDSSETHFPRCRCFRASHYLPQHLWRTTTPLELHQIRSTILRYLHRPCKCSSNPLPSHLQPVVLASYLFKYPNFSLRTQKVGKASLIWAGTPPGGLGITIKRISYGQARTTTLFIPTPPSLTPRPNVHRISRIPYRDTGARRLFRLFELETSLEHNSIPRNLDLQD